MKPQLRRRAFHEVIIDGKSIPHAVVETLADRVIRVYPFEGEPPHTEWVGGTAHILADKLHIKINQ